VSIRLPKITENYVCPLFSHLFQPRNDNSLNYSDDNFSFFVVECNLFFALVNKNPNVSSFCPSYIVVLKVGLSFFFYAKQIDYTPQRFLFRYRNATWSADLFSFDIESERNLKLKIDKFSSFKQKKIKYSAGFNKFKSLQEL
jgi:hypothetical protein